MKKDYKINKWWVFFWLVIFWPGAVVYITLKLVDKYNSLK